MKKIILYLVLVAASISCNAQEVIPLYSGSIPNSKDVPNEEVWVPNKEVDTIVNHVSVPTLTVFLPSAGTATGTAVIICPGGGYHTLLINREGKDVAKAFNQKGVAAFVLKYRLPSERTMINRSIGPLQDAQKAIELVRQRAEGWHISPNRIGIMGFSAGGHLAATAGTHFSHAFIEDEKATSLRPDFMILIYPVISFTDSIGHIGSRNNLLGPSPSKKEIEYFSNELWVSSQTPPTFLAQAVDDKVVSSKNSLYFYKALHREGISAELHLYEKGEHGFLTAPPFEEWFGRCLYWMKSNQLIP